MTRKFVFLLIVLLLSGIGFAIVYLYTIETGHNLFKEPLATINHNIIWNTPHTKLQLNLKKLPVSYSAQQENSLQFSESDISRHSILDYVSIGECPENQLAPDYLSQKLGHSLTNQNGRNSRLLPTCGFIKTKLPF